MKNKRQSRKFGFILFRVIYEPMLYLRAVYRQLLVLLLLFILGTFIFGYFDQLPPLVALFASVSTVTIIGLYAPNNGNFTTMNKTEGILVMGLILASVTAGASVIQGLVSVAANKEMVRGKLTKRLIANLKGHIVVYGYNHMGKYVTDKLGEMGYDYVVISRNADVYSELLKSGVFVIFETDTDRIGALKSAGIDKASMVIVTDINDSDNMRFILTARKLRPDIKIHTVVNDPSLVETARDAGANVVIPSSVAVGQLLAFSAGSKDLAGVVFSEKMGTQGITEFMIRESSPLIGRKLQEVAKLAKVAGVLHDGKVDSSIFGGSFTLGVGDLLLVIGDTSNLKKFKKEKAN